MIVGLLAMSYGKVIPLWPCYKVLGQARTFDSHPGQAIALMLYMKQHGMLTKPMLVVVPKGGPKSIEKTEVDNGRHLWLDKHTPIWLCWNCQEELADLQVFTFGLIKRSREEM